jgi:beta-N-acetylhexosaminidase
VSTLWPVAHDLSLEQQIGQLLWLHDTDRLAVRGGWSTTVERMVAEGRAGGLYPGPLQLLSPAQTAELNRRLQVLAPIPLLIGADLETGLGGVMAAGATGFPTQLGLGAAFSVDLAGRVAAALAREARAVGINTAFGPVLDVNSNPANPIVGPRSFGETPELVAALGQATIDAMQAEHLLACVKHFPGHGATDGDSHLDLPVVSRSLDQLAAVDLAPFRAAFARGVPAVMTAHVAFPALDPSGLPATLSPRILTDLLREELGFAGACISDAMSMAAITRSFSPGEASVRAFLAGCDLILTIYGEAAHAGLLAAARSGRIPEARLTQSVDRVLALKQRYCRVGPTPPDPAALAVVGSALHRDLAREAAERAVVVLSDAGLPLAPRSRGVLAVLQNAPAGNPSPVPDLAEALRRRVAAADVLEVSQLPTPGELGQARERAAAADTVILAPLARVLASRGESGGQAAGFAELISWLRAAGKHVVVLVVGSPYLFGQLPPADAELCTHGDAPACLEAGVAALFGELRPTGRLAVTIAGRT